MDIKLILSISVFLISVSNAETVYKTVDAEGNVYFSDTKTENAEIIKIKDAQIIDLPKIRSSDVSKKEPIHDVATYSELVIISPKDDSTVRNSAGEIKINLNIVPELKQTDTVLLFVDGKQVLSGRSPQLLLSNIDRGTHTIEAAIKNEPGDILIRSNKVILHLKRMSRLFSNFPDAPAPTQ